MLLFEPTFTQKVVVLTGTLLFGGLFLFGLVVSVSLVLRVLGLFCDDMTRR